ncbi:AMP-binding protein [Actinocrispum wychmicini]|uniref:Fatty-acyl-CoA synthase n=1 Tax=Actinocrispum wychmicini TaxID=1213861 RepID=A0A4R2JL02_9PSEU|nr:AMP-binding protein [Actinocrispum wychmicini]TCO60723.1 fatty-acyl-CoA synthase [Actinocrispum wychmicini]
MSRSAADLSAAEETSGSAPDSPCPDSCFYLDTLLSAFHRNADRVAVVHDGGSLTYADLLDEMYRLARALEGVGLGRGDGVAAFQDNTPGTLLVWMASRLLGCYFVGIPTYSSASEQAKMLEFMEVSVLVYEPGPAAERAAALAGQHGVPTMLSLGPGPVGTDLLALAADQPRTPFPPRAREDDIADVLLTSGSTGGRLKAAAYTFQRLGELVKAWLAFDTQDVAGAAAYRAPGCSLLRFIAMTMSHGVAALPAMLNGATFVLQQSLDPGVALRAIEEQRISVLTTFPSHTYQLIDHPDVTRTDFASLRLLVYYGAPMSPARLKRAMAVFGPVLCQIYGQTETRLVCWLSPEDHAADRPELLRSIGRPLPGVEVQVRTGTAVAAVGEIGEICVRTAYQMNHYWRQPELTAETIVDGWIRTGDLGYLDAEGYVYLVDRLRDIVLVNAINCYTVDIENVLAGHPAVREAVAVGLPDPHTGEAVHAAVVRHPDAEVSEAELRALVRVELSELDEPRTVLFLDAIPVTRAGKRDKNAVRELVAQRIGSAGRSG